MYQISINYRCPTDIEYDTLCVVHCNDTDCDTTIIVLIPEEVITVDTIYRDVLPTDTVIEVCVTSGLDIAGPLTSSTVCGQGINSTATADTTECVAISINSAPLISNNTLCVVHCNDTECDTTIIILRPAVEIDTIYIPVGSDQFIDTCLGATIVELTAPFDSAAVCENGDGLETTPMPNSTNACITLMIDDIDNFRGSDTSCIVHCVNGLCDTTIIIAIKPVTDTIITPDTVLCLDDVIDLPGSITSTVICDQGTADTLVFNDGLGCDNGVVIVPTDRVDTMQLCVIHCDASLGLCDTTIIVVLPEEDRPEAVDDKTITTFNTPVTIPVPTNDISGDTIIVIGVLDPTSGDLLPTTTTVNGGTAVINPDGTITYTPATDFEGVDSFQYVICDESADTALCGPNDVDTAWVFITIGDCIVPQVITPNNDGYNETFYIPCVEGRENVELIIFNRWGNEVYRCSDYENVNDPLTGWDGTYMERPLPDGVYYYILRWNEGLQRQALSSFITLQR